jgi:hypothetical protein
MSETITAWNDLLYLGTVPGTTDSVDQWLKASKDAGIEYVVCLASPEELSAVSPEYASWVQQTDSLLPVQQLALDPSGPPKGETAHNFWDLAHLAAGTIAEHAPVFVHDESGLLRTTSFATAVLIVRGYSYEDARKALAALGTKEPTSEWADFLKEGPTDTGWEDQTDADGIDETDPGPNLERRPWSLQRDAYRDLTIAQSAHSSLRSFGLQTLLDPFSPSWTYTSHETKTAAFQALHETISGPDSDFERAYTTHGMMVLEASRLFIGTRMKASHIVAGALFLHAALDAEFRFPTDSSGIEDLKNRVTELSDGRTVKKVATALDHAGVPPLGRSDLDYLSHEGGSTSVEDKLDHMSRIIRAGIPLVDALMLYWYRYDDGNHDYVIRELPANLFALAGVAVKFGK